MKTYHSILRWLDSYQSNSSHTPDQSQALRLQPQDWVRLLPFVLMHLACLGVIWVGFSPVALIIAVLSYLIRMFAITAFYHRYFSHRSFKTNRLWQFIFAFIGASSAQRGPLWWAAHHRTHHHHADSEHDPHPPGRSGFLWSHMLWFMSERNFRTKSALVRDWRKFPELVFLDRFDMAAPVLYAFFIYGLGWLLQQLYPQSGVSASQLLVWGFFISTVALYHCTFTINSLAHTWGSRRFNTKDDSRNNALLAVLTLGEGWHNNHHHYPVSARQGFFWWEIDISFYLLWCMEKIGMISHLIPVPQRVLANISKNHTEAAS